MNDDTLKTDVAVLKSQTTALHAMLSDVEERQRSIATSVTRLEAGHSTVMDTLTDIKQQLDTIGAQQKQVAEHEIRLNNLDTGIKWGGGIVAALLAAGFGKLFGFH